MQYITVQMRLCPITRLSYLAYLNARFFEILASIKQHCLNSTFESSNIFHHTNVNRKSIPQTRTVVLEYSFAIFTLKIWRFQQ